MDQSPPKESRPPINLRIKFRSESVEQFIERYAVDVSRGGIFIRTREPLAVGTQLKLDFQFQNGGALMSGDGTVVWIREIDPNRTSVPPGMGVRFDKLTPESQAVLDQLLIEKAKRERGGVPGSGGQGAGGIAVRRPSSMFSVLESPATANASANADKAAPVPAAAPAPTPISVSAAVDAPAPSASGGYRPLGTARNPFSAVTGTGASLSSTPATSPDTGSARPTGSRISQRLTPTDAAAPFDDLSDEPTQIAGRLPSFLTSDEEATTVAPQALAGSPRAAPQQPSPAGGSSSENPRTPAPEPRRFPTSLGMKSQPTDRKTGTQTASPGSTEASRWKQSLDHVPPFAGEPSQQGLQQGLKDPSRDTAKDIAAAGANAAHAQEGGKTPLPVASPGTPLGHAPRLSAPAPVIAGPASPGATEAPTPRPSVAAVAAIASGAAAVAASAAAGRATSAAAKIAPIAPHAHAATQQAAKAPAAPSVKKRSPAALVGLTVIVLGASAIFVFRFFGSHATEPISPTSAPTGVVATGEPAAITAPAAVPAVEATNPPPIPSAPPSTGTTADPTGAGKPAAPPAPAAVPAAPEPVLTKPASPAPDKAPRAPLPEVKADAPATSGQKSGKVKAARASRDTGSETTPAAPAPAEPKPAQPATAPLAAAATPPATAAAPAAAAAAPAAAAAAPAPDEGDATAHQIRITSKPPGADVALDGQTIGKTPYSIGIADISAPHFIAVRKDGFEPFEQMISASSTWTKTKGSKGKTTLQVLKINAKLKQVGGAAAVSPGGAGESKPTTEPPATDPASKVEVVRPDRPLPPSDERAPAPAESPP